MFGETFPDEIVRVRYPNWEFSECFNIASSDYDDGIGLFKIGGAFGDHDGEILTCPFMSEDRTFK